MNLEERYVKSLVFMKYEKYKKNSPCTTDIDRFDSYGFIILYINIFKS